MRKSLWGRLAVVCYWSFSLTFQANAQINCRQEHQKLGDVAEEILMSKSLRRPVKEACIAVLEIRQLALKLECRELLIEENSEFCDDAIAELEEENEFVSQDNNLRKDQSIEFVRIYEDTLQYVSKIARLFCKQ